MLLRVGEREREAVLRAMASVATAGGRYPLSAMDRCALLAANHVVFGATTEVEPAAFVPIAAAELPQRVPPESAERTVEFLTVMALVDGELDAARLRVLREYAAALHVREDYFIDIAEAARGHLAWVAADLGRKNVISITAGRVTRPEEFPFLPYREGGGEPQLAARYRGLATLPDGTLGREFLRWYQTHRFALPGEPDGLNERFAQPHDSLHLLSGYSTSPQGEILVSTLTAGTLGVDGFGAHILPVIFSWHIGIALNQVAGSFRGALAPEKFWVAWDRGAAMRVNCFAETWDFWRAAPAPLADLRVEYGVPPLAPEFAADAAAPDGYRPIA